MYHFTQKLLNTLKLIVATCVFVFASRAAAMPAEIVILRHAEKPSVGKELSEVGWERARALPRLFSSRPELTQFGPPVEVIGMSQRPGHSVRAIQTVSFLSQSLNVQTNTNYQPGDISQLVRDITTDPRLEGKTVVICWHRNNLPELIEAFGGPRIDRVPKHLFDRLWVLHMINGPAGEQVRLQEIAQMLLPGDSTN